MRKRKHKAGRSISIYGIGLDRYWGVVVEFFLVIYLLISMVQVWTDVWGDVGALIYLLISMVQE